VKIRFEQCAGVRVLHIENKFTTAQISLFGGQLLTWQPKQETHPVLWMSPLARFDGNVAIRGGVPLCWPWFDKHPSLPTAPAHGYALLSTWEPDRIEMLDDGRTELLISLPTEAQTGENRCLGLGQTVRFTIGKMLDIELTTRNESAEALTVTDGLHTYFLISDVTKAFVTGLSGCNYVDLLNENGLSYQVGLIAFGEEVGGIFTKCDRVTAIEDSGFSRKISVRSQGSRSIAVWNPGKLTAARVPDLGEQGWRTMVCVETANALENQVMLEPGATHALTARYSLESFI
jgi:glucose-6-phosphate 1-epimerase